MPLIKTKKNQRKKFGKLRNREIQLKSNEQEYGVIIQALGDCRFLLMLEDRREVIGILKGSFRNRVYININDFVLVALRSEFDRYKTMMNEAKEKVDIILKYYPAEVSFLTLNHHIKYISKNTLSHDDNLDDEIQDDEDHEFDEFLKKNNDNIISSNDIDI